MKHLHTLYWGFVLLFFGYLIFGLHWLYMFMGLAVTILIGLGVLFLAIQTFRVLHWVIFEIKR